MILLFFSCASSNCSVVSVTNTNVQFILRALHETNCDVIISKDVNIATPSNSNGNKQSSNILRTIRKLSANFEQFSCFSPLKILKSANLWNRRNRNTTNKMGNGPSCLDEPCEDCPLLERMRQSLRRNVNVDNFSTNEVVGQEISGKKDSIFFLKQHYSVFFSFSLLTVRQFRTDLDIGGYKGGGAAPLLWVQVLSFSCGFRPKNY